MPTYEADLSWLKQTHPEEYAKLPESLLSSTEYVQQHMSFYPDGDAGPEMWCIGLFPVDEESDNEPYFVELGLERPAPDDLPGKCRSHTLRVSREFCPVCCDLVGTV